MILYISFGLRCPFSNALLVFDINDFLLCQEQRLEQQRREKEQHVLELKKKQEQDIQRANSVRMSREQQQILVSIRIFRQSLFENHCSVFNNDLILLG